MSTIHWELYHPAPIRTAAIAMTPREMPVRCGDAVEVAHVQRAALGVVIVAFNEIAELAKRVIWGTAEWWRDTPGKRLILPPWQPFLHRIEIRLG
jgi:hypothetical protein